MGRYVWLMAGAALAAAAIAGCGGDGGATKPTATAGRTPTPAATAEPSPKQSEPEEYTGVPELDAIIAGFLQHDAKNLLLPNLRYSVLPCGVEPGMGGSPPCRADQEAGTPVEVMPFSACEFGYYRPHEFEPILAEFAQQDLVAVFAATPEVRFPGDYVLILVRPRPDDPSLQIASEVIVKDGRIVGIHASCVLTLEELVAEHHLGEPLYTPEGR